MPELITATTAECSDDRTPCYEQKSRLREKFCDSHASPRAQQVIKSLQATVAPPLSEHQSTKVYARWHWTVLLADDADSDGRYYTAFTLAVVYDNIKVNHTPLMCSSAAQKFGLVEN